MSKGFCSYALAAFPRKDKPKRFFVDLRRFPLYAASDVGRPTDTLGPIANVTTTDVGKAWLWTEQSGPYQYMTRHPELRQKFYVLPVESPAAAVTAAEKRGLLGRRMPVRRLKTA